MIRPLNDVVIVELEPVPEKVGGILIPDPDKYPTRTGWVLAAGPGKRHSKTDRLTPTQVKEGERICFHHANLQQSQGKQLMWVLPDNQALIKESDIFFVIDDGDLRIGL